ncbi:hypothetical protein BDV29DRAFT_142824 [Aspergillus leporis]|uniref:Uncharacterized protein n=1 Tax=Aspergillus leporis TaxID=41062 RepID=A0A5N5WZ36_9EURO|nr:hypothetical protein BDV29DRAFT_142824 [Aspergillus leporis]
MYDLRYPSDSTSTWEPWMNLSFLFFFTCLGFYQLNPRLRSATSVAKPLRFAEVLRLGKPEQSLQSFYRSTLILLFYKLNPSSLIRFSVFSFFAALSKLAPFADIFSVV